MICFNCGKDMEGASTWIGWMGETYCSMTCWKTWVKETEIIDRWAKEMRKKMEGDRGKNEQ